MHKTMRMYVFVNDFLLCVISAYDYLQEFTSVDDEKSVTSAKWHASAGKVAMMLSDEPHNAIDNNKAIHELEKTRVYATSSLVMEALEERCVEKLQEDARRLHKSYSGIDDISILYYGYLAFLRQTLLRYEALLKAEPLLSSLYYPRYQNNVPMFEDLGKLLEGEREAAEDIRSSLSEEEVPVFWAQVDEYAGQLADDWKQIVIAVSDDLDYQLPEIG